MLLINISLKLSCRARRYTNSGVSIFDRNTINSVEPVPTSPSFKHCTNPVLPFSKHGVIRATNVSPIMNFEPEKDVRRSVIWIDDKLLLRPAISTKLYESAVGFLLFGLASIALKNGVIFQLSGIKPISDSINLTLSCPGKRK
ncbi:hypothetical protein SDC9_133164 [bioreactor metagenome]|uniref:Uncharacterized protein n=1 Tax=bioreactor metagenome TaxID=1076179 RepID=A0A645D9X6_9ZZZZ